MKKLVLVLMVLGLALPVLAGILTPNDDVTSRDGKNTNYDEAVLNSTTAFGLFVKTPGNESYIEYTLGNTAASNVMFQVYEADTNVTGWWQVDVKANEYDFDETLVTNNIATDSWENLGNFTVYAESAVGLYSLDITDWYNANLGKTMTFSMEVLGYSNYDIYHPDSGPIFEDREGTWASLGLAGTTTGPQLLVTEVPEPATMALLGLGALVLRRKR